MDKFEIFEKWLLDNGAKFPKLYLKVMDIDTLSLVQWDLLATMRNYYFLMLMIVT